MSGKILEHAFPLSIELTGILIIIIGIAVELSTKAEHGHMLISIGSALVALGSIIWSKILGAKRRS